MRTYSCPAFELGRLWREPPWGAYARMNDEDLRSVYQYLRSLPPVEHETGAPLQEK
jgi:hypothetical protein